MLKPGRVARQALEGSQQPATNSAESFHDAVLEGIGFIALNAVVRPIQPG
jgi:hypothetical protein